MGAAWGRLVWIVFALCGVSSVSAQDITLTARDGSISLSGSLAAYDGEFYRINSPYGLLTVDRQGVICSGPGCPDLVAPRAVIRIVGDLDAGETLIQALLAAFAKSRGYALDRPDKDRGLSVIRDRGTNQVLAEVMLIKATPEVSHAALADGRAELSVGLTQDSAFASRVVALDALVAIVPPENRLPSLSTADLGRALAGEAANWSAFGGADTPVVVHSVEPDAPLAAAIAERLGQRIAASVWHPDQHAMAAAVAADPWALAVVGLSQRGNARILPLTDSCGFELSFSRTAIRSGDYPYVIPILFHIPPRRLPLIAREILEFLSSDIAGMAIADLGYVGQLIDRQPLDENGLRLFDAIGKAGDETGLADLQALVAAMAGADRLSLTFRFEEDGTGDLDTLSQDNVARLAGMIGAGLFRNERLVLVGFSDGSGSAADNLELSLARANAVLSALQATLPDVPADHFPGVEGYGEVLPIACDTTEVGRRLNRRVELWVRPATPGQEPMAKDNPTPEN